MPRCLYCLTTNGSRCGAAIRTTKPALSITCTRQPGHKGPHVWCDGSHALARWPKAEPGSTVTAVVAKLLREAVVEGHA